jgi:hypothetical protein
MKMVCILKGVNFPEGLWWTQGYGGPDQILYMKEWGCTVVRLTTFPDRPDPAKWPVLDEMVQTALANGITCVVNAHYWVDGLPNFSQFTEAQWMALHDHLRFLTTRYPNPNVYINVLNEPMGLSGAQYQSKMRELIDVVRAVDPNKTIVVDAQCISGEWQWLKEETFPIERNNIILSPHWYFDAAQSPSKADIRWISNNNGWKWAIDNGRKVWLGEFNYIMGLSDGPTWMRNFMEVCEEDGWLGFAAWHWAERWGYELLLDWNGTPSENGSVLMEGLTPVSPPTKGYLKFHARR